MFEEMTPKQKEVAWIGGGLAAATLIAVLIYEHNASASASSAVADSSAPTGTTLVTAPTNIQSAQTLLAQYVTNQNSRSGATQMVVPTATGVIDSATTAAVQSFQTEVNQEFITATSLAAYQTKYGTAWVPLRTDGVLDGNTYQTLVISARDGW